MAGGSKNPECMSLRASKQLQAAMVPSPQHNARPSCFIPQLWPYIESTFL